MEDTTNNASVSFGRSETDLSIKARNGADRPLRKGLPVRFVTRMSDDLSDAVAAAAREDGVTAGAFVRRMLLDRVGVQSPGDARSGWPIRKPDEDAVAIAAAVRTLASVSAAVAVHDEAAAKAALHEARSLLIPLVVRRPAP